MSKFFMFLSGVAVGATATWYALNKRFELRLQEESEAVREAFARRADEENEEKGYSVPKSVEVCPKPDLEEYTERIRKAGYVDYSALSAEAKKTKEAEPTEEQDIDEIRPYVISPEEFDTKGYDVQSLTYYADGVLTDVNDIVVENVDDIVGEESLEHFGEYEEDSVYVRNERLGVEYEILLDSRTYEQKIHPSQDLED